MISRGVWRFFFVESLPLGQSDSHISWYNCRGSFSFNMHLKWY